MSVAGPRRDGQTDDKRAAKRGTLHLRESHGAVTAWA